jgi:hypothetical protein
MLFGQPQCADIAVYIAANKVQRSRVERNFADLLLLHAGAPLRNRVTAGNSINRYYGFIQWV